MQSAVKHVVIVGGGTAGWLSAALIKKVLGSTLSVTLIESEQIGTVGVGEATIPPIRHVNQTLGLDEATFLTKTKATVKLAIRFENWRKQNEAYYHTFGSPGRSMAFCHFHHFWNRARLQGDTTSLWDYDMNYLCAVQGKFAQINSKDPITELPFAYHFDAGLYAQFLRQFSENLGVERIEGKINHVQRDSTTGFVTALQTECGKQIQGDFFIDCSGFRGLLIEQALNTGYDDWSHWLPCDTAIAVPTERHEKTLPFTRSIARQAGWQWRIPLQHRNGNGHVFCSKYQNDDEATDVLMANLDTKPLADPRIIRFTTGRRRKQWNKNVVAIGLSSGFLEPLESTSIHLIQSGIVRLLHLFPHQGIQSANVNEYNQQSEVEFEQIRDFLILHYILNERDDSDFWIDRRRQDVPERLAHKMALFEENGKLFREQNDLFLESSWLQVMLGQGLLPKDYHPLANGPSPEKLRDMLGTIKRVKNEPLSKLPSHDEYLSYMVGG